MNFLRLPPGAAASALGGMSIADHQGDLSGSFQNPALLRSTTPALLHCSFLVLPGGSNAFFVSGSLSKASAPFASALAIQYIDHGENRHTDASGNTLGLFRPRDWSFQYVASIPYRTRWRGGAAIQFAQSTYSIYRAAACMTNLGLQYQDTSYGLEAGVVLRHAGFFIRRYDPGSTPQLPLELSFGVWKRWTGTPFSFGVSLQRMQRWKLDAEELYDDAWSLTGLDNRQSTFAGQFFNHLILSTRIELHPKLQVLGGYNFLRRRELSWAGSANGLTGFSLGLRAKLDRFELSYGRTNYQPSAAINQLSLEFSWKGAGRGWRK
jgi:hypothetical protein